MVLATAWNRRGMAYRDRDVLESLRDRRVRHLVRFAASTVPYYRDWFCDNGVDPQDIRGAYDLAELPVLEKSVVRSNPEHFRSVSRRGRTAIRFSTSGSTGKPLVFYHDRRSVLANIAHGQHDVRTHFIGKKYGYTSLGIARRASTASKVRGFCKENTFIPVRFSRQGLDVADPLDKVVRMIRDVKPDVIQGYGSYLEMLFRYLHERDIDVPLPRLVSYAADGMTLPGRQLITETFGLPVVANYNAVECFKIGFQCGAGPSYHLHEDLCHVRIADEQGRTLPEGGVGSVIITNLVNRGTVLLHYRIGDVAALPRDNCNCGRSLRLLEHLEGRIEDMLLLQGGDFMHPRAIWAVLRTAGGLLRYQLIQHRTDVLKLKLVTTTAEAYREILKRQLPELQSLFGTNTRIETAHCDDLPPDPSGKFRPVVSKCRWGEKH